MREGLKVTQANSVIEYILYISLVKTCSIAQFHKV
jgi:hypothetical protein